MKNSQRDERQAEKLGDKKRQKNKDGKMTERNKQRERGVCERDVLREGEKKKRGRHNCRRDAQVESSKKTL